MERTCLKIILYLCYSKTIWMAEKFAKIQGLQFQNWFVGSGGARFWPLNLLIFIKPRFVSGFSGFGGKVGILGVLSDLKVGRASLVDEREGIGILVKLELFGCSPLIIINEGRSRNRNVTFMDYFSQMIAEISWLIWLNFCWVSQLILN